MKAIKHTFAGLTQAEMEMLPKYLDGELDLYGTEVFDKLYTYWMAEMPYGVAKCRDGDPCEWILDQLESCGLC